MAIFSPSLKRIDKIHASPTELGFNGDTSLRQNMTFKFFEYFAGFFDPNIYFKN